MIEVLVLFQKGNIVTRVFFSSGSLLQVILVANPKKCSHKTVSPWRGSLEVHNNLMTTMTGG
jgi:hypothetical protein